MSLALGCIIGGSYFILPGTSFLKTAGPMGIVIAMCIGGTALIVIALNYSFMINKLPYAGGEFTYANEVFGRKHAFACSWFLSLSYIAIVPMNATFIGMIGRTLFGGLSKMGFHYSIAGYDVYMVEILLAYIVLMVCTFISIKGIEISGKFQTVLVLALILGVGLLVIAAIVNPNVGLGNLQPLYVPNKGRVGCVVSVLVATPYLFVGFDTIPQSAEEFHFSPKKVNVIMVVSIVFSVMVCIAINLITAIIVPDGYGNWLEYISDLPNVDGLLSMPTFHAAHQLLGKGGMLIVGIAALSACLTCVIGFMMASTRLLYAMAKEKVIPEFFAKLTPDSHTPKNAIIFVFLLSLVAPILGRNVVGWIVNMSSLGAAIGYGYTSAAAFKYAKNDGNIGVMVTGVIGVIMSIIFALLLLIPIPKFGCSLSLPEYICLVVWIILGILFYRVSNSNNK
jgi:amino acid transporter